MPTIRVILIVEDNPADALFTKKLLTAVDKDVEVRTAGTLSGAIEALGSCPVDLVLLDLGLPDARGLEGLTRLRAAAPCLPIVVLTGDDTRKTGVDALKNGAQEYLVKGEITGPLLHRAVIYSVARKQDEQRMARRNHFVHTILESLEDPFLVVKTSDRKVILANSAARQFGWRRGICCHELFYGQNIPCADDGCPVARVVQTGRRYAIREPRQICGRPALYEVHAFPWKTSSGQPKRVILSFMDVTRRQETLSELRKLGAVVEQMPDGIAILDRNARIEYVNPAFETMTGFDYAAVVGRPPFQLVDERLQKEFEASVWPRVREGENWLDRAVLRKKNGSRFEASAQLRPVRCCKGSITHVVANIRDITGKRRLEAIAEAVNLMNNTGAIFSGLRHEIGNPINSTKVALTVLRRNLSAFTPEKVAAYVDRSLEELARVESLLKAMRNFSMFEKPVLRETRLEPFLERFVELIRQDFAVRGVAICLKIGNPPVNAWTDTRALHQVLLNLMTNAADALEGCDTPKISVHVRGEAALVRLEVTDNGRGMTPEIAQNLFKPFHTTKSQGTGLGLVIVKKMLSRMQASIRIRTQSGVGTRVIMFLPAFSGLEIPNAFTKER